MNRRVEESDLADGNIDLGLEPACLHTLLVIGELAAAGGDLVRVDGHGAKVAGGGGGVEILASFATYSRLFPMIEHAQLTLGQGGSAITRASNTPGKEADDELDDDRLRRVDNR